MAMGAPCPGRHARLGAERSRAGSCSGGPRPSLPSTRPRTSPLSSTEPRVEGQGLPQRASPALEDGTVSGTGDGTETTPLDPLSPGPQEPPPMPVFTVVKSRWIVKRTFAWLGRNRRLSKNYEYFSATWSRSPLRFRRARRRFIWLRQRELGYGLEWFHRFRRLDKREAQLIQLSENPA